MKKTTKLFAGVALSAALALGTALPAFAADDPAPVDDQGVGQTTVKVTAENGNVSATVPLFIPLSTNTDGGAYTPPTDGTYQITNTGVFGIEVKQIEIVPIDNSGWTLVDKNAITDAMVGKDADLSGITENYGKISMEMTPGTVSKVEGSDDVLAFAGLAVDLGAAGGPSIVVKDQWKIERDSYLPIKIAGQTSRLKNATPDAGVDAFKVKYTIQ